MSNKLPQNGRQTSVLNLIQQQLMVMTQQLELLKKIQHSGVPASQQQHIKESLPAHQNLESTFGDKVINPTNGILDPINRSVEEEHISASLATHLENQKNSTSELIFPLSSGQRNLWFLSNLGADKSAAYNESVVLRLRGELQIPILKTAMQNVVARRDALRIISINPEGQAIASSLHVEIPCLILSEKSEQVKQKQVDAWLEAVTTQTFDLNQGPFFRLQLAQVNHQEYLMVLVVHHLIADGWSVQFILQEITEFYSALCVGKELYKPEPTLYSSYLEWLVTLQTSQEVEKDYAYWIEVCNTSIPSLALPTDYPKPARTYKGENQTVTLDRTFYQQLKQFSQAQGATVFMTLLAAWKIFLSRLTRQERLVVGIPTAGQMIMGVRDLVGHCSSLLPIVSSPAGDLVFIEFLASVKKTLFDVYEHQNYFFTDGLSQVQPQVTTIFNIDKMIDIPKLHGLEVMLMPSPVCFAKFDLSLNGIQYQDKFILDFTYRTDLFDHQTISHWCRSFLILLKGIIASPTSRLYQLPLMPPEEHNQKFFSEAGTVWDIQPIHQQFESQVSRNPDAIAITVGNESISYKLLNYRANQLARYLKAQNPDAQPPIAVYLQHPIKIAIAILALFKIGMSVAVINSGLNAEQFRLAMDKYAESLLLTERQLLASLVERKLDLVTIDDDWQIISNNSGENLHYVNSESYIHFWHPIDCLQLSYLAVCHHIASLQKLLPHNVSDRISIINCFHLGESFDILLHSLTFGTSLDVISWQDSSNSEIIAAFENKASTTVFASVESLVCLARTFSVNPELLSVKQRWVILDRGKLGYGLVTQLTKCLGQSVEFYRVYKLPVISLSCAVKQLMPLPQEPYSASSQAVSLGDAIAPMSFSVRDSYAQILPVGIPGELCVEHPLFNHAGIWISTGDLARQRSDGSIEITGYIDGQIDLKEIELTLSLCSLVKEVIVTENKPQEFRVYVVLTKDELQYLQEVEELLKSLLATPEIFVLIQVETIPRSPSGDINYSALRQMPEVSLKAADFVAPLNTIEQAIAHCIQQTLGKNLVGVYDNFFDLGLSSLQGTQLVSRIQAELSVDISLRDLFEAPTVASLAARISDRKTPPLPPIQPLLAPTDLSGTKPQFWDYELSPAQRSLWLHAQMDEGAIAYNLSMSLLLEGDLDVVALQRAFQTIVARHESLRTTFVLVEDEPKQRVHKTIDVPLESIDISGDQKPLELASKYGLQEAQKPFDLTQCPLMRTKLLKLSDTKHILLFTIHHIIIDGWSLDILGREIFDCYAAYRLGQEHQLPPLRIHYKDYAVWHNALLQTDRLAKQRDYWHNKLLGAQPALNLPTDFTRPSAPTFKGSMINLIFDPLQTAALNRLSRNYNASLYMTLVAAVKTLFYRITQHNDIIVGTSFAERPHPDLEGQIGFFINPLVLRDAIAINQSFVSVLHQVRQTILEALENTLYPFDILANELQQLERNLQGSSLFEVQVVMHNHPQTHTQGDHLKVSTFENIVLASRFDLIFNFIERDDQLQLDIEYKTDLWKPERIEVMKERFYALVVDIIAHPHKKLDDLNFQTSYEESTEETELLFNLDF